MANNDVAMTLDQAVQEVLRNLTGLNLQYEPELDRYQTITFMLNKALRAVALESEWSCYADTEDLGSPVAGENVIRLRDSIRPRIQGDDAVRLSIDGIPIVWAYFLPRDSLHKYRNKAGLWCSVVDRNLVFSRPFTEAEEELTIEMPVMREPVMFLLPEQPEDPDANPVPVPDEIREQLVDFYYPDLVVAKALYFYAQTDPVAQPRVPTLEQDYKNIMYQLTERDTKATDSPYLNEFILPIQNDIYGSGSPLSHGHPHSATRRF